MVWVLVLVLPWLFIHCTVHHIEVGDIRSVVEAGTKIENFVRHHNYQVYQASERFHEALRAYSKAFQESESIIAIDPEVIYEHRRRLERCKRRVLKTYRALKKEYEKSNQKIIDLEETLLLLPT